MKVFRFSRKKIRTISQGQEQFHCRGTFQFLNELSNSFTPLLEPGCRGPPRNWRRLETSKSTNRAPEGCKLRPRDRSQRRGSWFCIQTYEKDRNASVPTKHPTRGCKHCRTAAKGVLAMRYFCWQYHKITKTHDGKKIWLFPARGGDGANLEPKKHRKKIPVLAVQCWIDCGCCCPRSIIIAKLLQTGPRRVK